MHDEFAKIDWLKKRFEKGTVSFSEVIVGIGDDAAVIDFGGRPTIVTVDAQVEGVHFRRDLISCRELGRRAVIAAASDVWAMASTPSGAVIALTLPNGFADADYRELIEGIAEASELTGARIIGGNLSHGHSLSITTTVFGLPEAKPIMRSGARPGDRIYVTGELGGAALGLALLQAGASDLENAESFVARWRRPPVHGRIVQELARCATSTIDISDGCLQDLQHVCAASGVGAVIYAKDLPKAPGYLKLCKTLDLDPVELALTGGEDYELLFTAPADAAGIPATSIGEIVRAREVQVLDDEGRPIQFDRPGYRHFS
ncbi:MAG: thiamine-phosphate kinase [Myxococcales bacterium]|nr:thiamine-phosphate kinase [Myxococcales bacterium]MDH3485029.1 thiamine-phosphate kinase [Myxococcales bacterium]